MPSCNPLLQKVGTGKRTRVCLGPRFLAEMEGWLEEEDRPSAPWKCAKCDKVDRVFSQCVEMKAYNCP